MKKLLCLLLAVGVLVMSFAACSAGDKATMDNSTYKEELGYGTDESVAASSSDTALERKIIHNAELSVDTKKFDGFIAALDKEIEKIGGYTESSETYNLNRGNGYRSATIVLRVPADKLNSFINAVGELGSISSKNISSNDVTSQYIDIESRLNALKTEQQALMGLLEKATALNDILEIQDRLSDVTGELESYQARLNDINSQVSYSKVTLNVREVELDPTGDEQGFWGETGTRFMNNLYSIGEGAKALAMWLISSIPYLLLLAGVVCAIWLPIRAKRRKKAKTAKAPEQK